MTARPKSALLAGLAVGLLLTASSAFAKGSPWLHLEVNDPSDDTSVNLNVPLSLAELVLDVVDTSEVKTNIRTSLPGELSISDLRKIWNELDAVGDAVLFTAKEKGSEVRIAREGSALVIRASEDGGEQVRAHVPGRVVDALFSGKGEDLNLRAAIHELKHAGRSDILNIQDGESTVRLYVK